MIKACILRVGGTNCDRETKRALDSFEKVKSEILHLNKIKKQKNLMDYDLLVLPGGFSYGDHIRAGTVFANEIITEIGEEIREFAEEEKAILGICNGFQVLIETGLLPGLEKSTENPTAALAINESAKYECRWVYLKNENYKNCIFTNEIKKERLFMPVAHAEGRFMVEKEKTLKKLEKNNQIVLKYCDESGKVANKKYPQNPNGSIEDIAGICDPTGKIFGLMPHPERAFYGHLLPNWTRKKEIPKYADGRLLFKSLIKNLR